MKKFKIAMIGTGGRSVAYARAFGKSEEIEIVAVADPNRRNIQTMFHLSGISGEHIKQYEDWHQLLENHHDLDGATVITPNYLHREPAVALLKRGIAVALEKPKTTTMRDSEQIVEAVQNSGRIL
ncbi:MAG: Gfo/Idh/MocA family oxidoreductase, partial [Lentisphaeria bacterium]|nr:Gfo/Idh/MocA family oxidoreductase [Lentisphaeria bacterium]